MLKTEDSSLEYKQERLFIKESNKEYILMSDGQEVFCYSSWKNPNKESIVIFFVQGFASGVFPWSDLWDVLYKEFNLVILDPRDKETIKLKKKSECSSRRMALDIAETLHYLKIDETKVVFIGSSIGCWYIAKCINEQNINPLACFFIGPATKPKTPRVLTKIIINLPAFLVDKIGKFVARRYLRNKLSDGFQRQIYYNRINNVDAKRWKQCKSLQNWDTIEDFKKINCPVFIIKTLRDKYHEYEELEKVHQLIKDSHIIDTLTYESLHIKPKVNEFVEAIKNILTTKLI
ncbi:MAG: hypothetical protein ACTSP3_13515 [Candidatus Heimdallarchaeaceae archaeon]